MRNGSDTREPTTGPSAAGTDVRSAEAARTWTLWPLRVTGIACTVLVFAQAALAGSFLSGHYAALQAHEVTGLLLAGFGWLLPVTAVLVWRPGRLAGWPVIAALIAYVAIVVQTILGFGRSLAVHVPLGVLLLVALALLCMWSWPGSRASRDNIDAGPR